MEFLKKLRKISLRKVLPRSIILMVLGIALFMIFGCYDMVQFLAPKKLADLTPETMQGAYVEDDIYYFYTAYAQEKQYQDNRPTKVTGIQYVVDFDETYYMGLFIHQAELADAEEMMEACDAYYNGEIAFDELPVAHVRGTIEAMDSEVLGYYLAAAGGDAATESVMLPYYLDMNRMNNNTFAVMWIILAVSIVLFVLGLVPIIRALTGGYQKKMLAKLTAIGETDALLERLDRFYNSTQPISGVRIGPEFILFQSGATPILFRPWELAWAYQQTTRHRTNGIPTGKTHATILRMMDGRQHTLPMKEADVQALLAYIKEAAPGVVLGYSDELAQLYRQDRGFFTARWEEVRPGCTSRT